MLSRFHRLISAQNLISVLRTFFDATGISRRASPLPRAYYDMRLDEIHMPPIETFHDAARYYATLSHECGHNADNPIMPC
ncbi:zincin-like metallopeptidase domain-containing protein [Roseobacter sp. HKCCD8484]